MSTFDYAEIADIADEVLEEFGSDVTLSRPSTGTPTYSTSTGAVTAVSPATYNGRGAKFDYAQDQIDGTDIREGDQRLLLSPLQADGSAMPLPTTDDIVTIGSVTFSIARVKQIAPADVAVLYEVQIRGAEA